MIKFLNHFFQLLQLNNQNCNCRIVKSIKSFTQMAQINAELGISKA